MDMVDDTAFQEEVHREFNLSDSSVNMSVALVDPFGRVITSDSIPTPGLEENMDEEYDEDLVLSDEEQVTTGSDENEEDDDEEQN